MPTNILDSNATFGRLARLALVVLAFVGAIVALASASARAADSPVITQFDAGLSDYQAGGHADAFNSFQFATDPHPTLPGYRIIRGGGAKDIVVDLPPGLVGNPQVVDECTMSAFAEVRCSPMAQVGFTSTTVLLGPDGDGATFNSPVYNMQPDDGELAKLGFKVNDVTAVLIRLSLDPDDYRVRATVENAYDGNPAIDSEMTIWANPYSSSHNAQRLCEPAVFGCSVQTVVAELMGVAPPFLTNPAECGVDGFATLRVDSWMNPGVWSTATSVPQQVTGCEKLAFDPGVSVAPTGSGRDGASGLSFDLRLPLPPGKPNTLDAPPLRDARIALPEGMSINPSAAGGLEACSDAQLGLGTNDLIGCPSGSKVGSVVAESPVLENRVHGGIYIRSQASDEPESGEMFRLALVVEDKERGLLVKLPGSVSADSETGRLVTTFEDNPQLPVSRIRVDLKDGPRAPLSLPSECGRHAIDVRLSSWGGQRVDLRDHFTVDCPGPAGFAPGFEAGSLLATGGAFSPLVARIDRQAGERFLSGVDVDLPKGLVAKLRGVPLCGSFQAEHGGCPSGSRIGTATAGAGSGNPYYVKGDVYLTEGYRGAPYGLATHVHAKAGPFDLGWVRVRQALFVDPETAEITVSSDPLPRIVKGVPVRLRSIDVDADRPDFTINPTSCAAKHSEARLTAFDGQVHQAGSRFQATDCQALAFKPKLAMRLTGRRQTRTGSHPGFRTTATQKPGEAGIGRVKVTMPRSIALDANNSYDPKLVCDYDKSLQADCPASSVIGKAVAHTPVLNKPLAGNVHLVQGIKFGPTGNRIRTTPSLLVKLRGEVAINLRARTTTEKKTNRLVTTFPEVPDAPVSKFNLSINGGTNGILTVTRTRRSKINLCTNRQTANIQTTGHNGKHANYNTTVKTPCGKAAKAQRGKSKRAKR